MDSIERAVERLTQTHAVHLNGREYECAALLEQLREAISSSTGAGSGGGGGTGGNLLNLAALELWELIDGITRGWLREWGVNHAGDLPVVLQRLPHAIQAQHAAGAIDDDFRDRLNSAFDKWVWQIDDLFDPPHQKELTAPCPECGERYHLDVNMDGAIQATTRRAAVSIPVKKGRALVAECKCCGAMWATEDALVELAEGMGVVVDFVALREYANPPVEEMFAT